MHTRTFVRSISVLTAVALGLAGPALAQSPLTLDDAIARAVAQNPAVTGSQAAQRESTERVREARSGWLPRIEVSESWQRGNQPVFVFGSLLAQRRFAESNFRIDALNHPDAIPNYRAAISIEQVVFDGTRTLSAVRSASIGRELADAGARAVAASLRVATTQAYGQVLMAETHRAAAEAAVASADEDKVRIERRRDAGMATDADVLSLEVHRAQVRERLITATSQETVARARLNDVMGEPLDRVFTLRTPELDSSQPAALDEMEREALSGRPEAQQAAAGERRAKTAVTAARAAFLPQVAVQGTYETNGDAFDNRASSWAVGAVLKWNLFSGFADAARLGEARATLDRARAERQRRESDIRLDLRIAVANLDAARARVDVGRLARTQAIESRRIIRDRYDAGLATVNDLLRSASAVLDAESLYTAATVDVVISAALLDRARGR
jgi:outer membrane protein